VGAAKIIEGDAIAQQAQATKGRKGARGRTDSRALQQLDRDKPGLQPDGLPQSFQLRHGLSLHQHLGIPVDRDACVDAAPLPGQAPLKGLLSYPPGEGGHPATADYFREKTCWPDFPAAAVEPARQRFCAAHRAINQAYLRLKISLYSFEPVARCRRNRRWVRRRLGRLWPHSRDQRQKLWRVDGLRQGPKDTEPQ